MNEKTEVLSTTNTREIATDNYRIEDRPRADFWSHFDPRPLSGRSLPTLRVGARFRHPKADRQREKKYRASEEAVKFQVAEMRDPNGAQTANFALETLHTI